MISKNLFATGCNKNKTVRLKDYCQVNSFHIQMLKPFAQMTNLQQTTLKNTPKKWKLPLHESTIIEYSCKHGDKRRNCSFWAISSFVAMFSKSCLPQRRQKVSIWGKGVIMSNFSFGYNVFNSIQKLNNHLYILYTFVFIFSKLSAADLLYVGRVKWFLTGYSV